MPCSNVFRRKSKSNKATTELKSNTDSTTTTKEKEDKVDNWTNPTGKSEEKPTSSVKEPVANLKPIRLATPIKSSFDDKIYAVVRLHNGVEATLISTNGDIVERQRAACSVTVAAGSFDDPEEFPGLAHLLEHVLTSASDNYPELDSFAGFLGKIGGYQDAETEAEMTTFYFECPEKHFRTAMLMFSRFFVAPRLEWDTIKRERRAVDSEFAESFDSDTARRIQLICHCANPRNPAKKFGRGNSETLKTTVQRGPLIDALNLFLLTHFLGPKLKIAVQSNSSIEVLEHLIAECFDEIPKQKFRHSKTPSSRRSSADELFDMRLFARLYRIESTRAISELTLTWAVSSVAMRYKDKPLVYLSYVIGTEGEGSLIWRLRELGLALFLTAEVQENGLTSNNLFALFEICVRLTTSGCRQLELVFTTIFAYLSTLRHVGASEEVFRELTKIAKIHFILSTNVNAIDNVVNLSQNMTRAPPYDYLTSRSLFFEYRPEIITQYLSEMSPHTVNVCLQMRNHQLPLDKKERWYGTKYRVDPYLDEWLRNWSSIGPDSAFSQPKSNPYLTTIFEPIRSNEKFEQPKNIVKTEFLEIWHASVRSTVASVRIIVEEPSDRLTLQYSAIRSIFVKMFSYRIVEDLYFAHVAQIDCRIASVDSGTEFVLYGFSDQIGNVLTAIAKGLKNFKRQRQIRELDTFKLIQKRNAFNSMSEGDKLIDNLHRNLVVNNVYTDGELFVETGRITEVQLSTFVDNLFVDCYVKCLVEGNFEPTEAGNIIKEFVRILDLKSGQYRKGEFKARAIPKGNALMSVLSFNPLSDDCRTRISFQVNPFGSREICKLELIASMMKEPLYDDIRSKEQLGYTVNVDALDIKGVSSVVIDVATQTNKFPPNFVVQRIHHFVVRFVEYFHKLSDDQFAECKTIYVDDKLSRFRQLEERSSTNWKEIRYGRYDFDKINREIRELGRLGKKEAEIFVETIFGVNSKERRQLTIQAIGTKTYLGGINDDNDDEENTLGSEIKGGEVIYRYAENLGADSETRVVTDIFAWKQELSSLR